MAWTGRWSNGGGKHKKVPNVTDSIQRKLLARLVCVCICFSIYGASAEDAVDYRKGYVDGPFGQIHYHTAQPSLGAGDKTPVAFFHQNPRSAEEYRPLLEVVGRGRLALAFDTPGYGESDRPELPPDMTQIATAMAIALQGLGYGADGKGQVDEFGFHTGTFIAAELSILRPDLVRRIILSGIPYFAEEERLKRLAGLPRDMRLTEDGARILGRWAPIVNRRAEGVSLERAARIFVEHIHSLDKYWYASNAVWSYVPADRLPMIAQPILVLQPHESLTDATLKARRELIPNADLVELPHVIDDVFDTGPEDIGAALTKWLDSPR